jgi:hypothetical protein
MTGKTMADRPTSGQTRELQRLEERMAVRTANLDQIEQHLEVRLAPSRLRRLRLRRLMMSAIGMDVASSTEREWGPRSLHLQPSRPRVAKPSGVYSPTTAWRPPATELRGFPPTKWWHLHQALSDHYPSGASVDVAIAPERSNLRGATPSPVARATGLTRNAGGPGPAGQLPARLGLR